MRWNVGRTSLDQTPDAVYQAIALHCNIPRNGSSVKQHAEYQNPHKNGSLWKLLRGSRQGICRKQDTEHADSGSKQHSLDRYPEGAEEIRLPKDLLVREQVKSNRPEGYQTCIDRFLAAQGNTYYRGYFA